MSISVQDDSDGHTWQIWAQQQANSCTIASIWMARGIAMQTTFEESEWELAYRTYHAAVVGFCPEGGPPPIAAPQTLNHRAFPRDQSSMESTIATSGVFGGQVVDMLRHEGFTVASKGPGGIDPRLLGHAKPGLAFVEWRDDATGASRGGHCIVAARQTSTSQIVFLDPAGGRLRELPNNGRIPHSNRSLTGHIFGSVYLTGGGV